MRAARRQGVLGVVRCEAGLSPKVLARAPPIQHNILCGGYKRGLHAFRNGKAHRGRLALVHLRKKTETGEWRKATSG